MSAVQQSPATSPQLVKPSSIIIKSIKSGFNTLFFSSDFGVLSFLVILLFVVGLGTVILFETGIPSIRGQMINTTIGIILGIFFIILVFQQMGNTVNFFGRKLDLGMIYYLAILIIVMVIFSG